VDLYIISSCGQSILVQTLDMLKRSGTIGELPNTATYIDKKYRFSEVIDDVAPSGGVSINWQNMPQSIFESGVVSMQASYGCPYSCAYCNFMKDRRLMGVKPLDALVEELLSVQKKGARYVWFIDDNFRLGQTDLDVVCRRFIDSGITVKWKSFIRASAMKNVDMELLKAAGCTEMAMGLESADTDLLNAMNKKASPALYADVIERALKAGINCSAYFIFGFPGETEETVRRTIDFMKSLEHPELEGYIYFSTFPFIIAPLSPVSAPESARKYGLVGHMFKWRHDTMNSAEAMAHASRAFFELEYTGTLYPGDNLDMLLALPARKRKEFIAIRHRLAKKAIRGSKFTAADFAAECAGIFSKTPIIAREDRD